MRSPDSSTRPDNDGADPAPSDVAAPGQLRADRAVRSVEEFVAFLVALEAVFGADDRQRPPTLGDRFLL